MSINKHFNKLRTFYKLHISVFYQKNIGNSLSLNGL